MHALGNVTAKLPERHHRALTARWWQIFDDAASPAEARRRLQAISPALPRRHPTATSATSPPSRALRTHDQRSMALPLQKRAPRSSLLGAAAAATLATLKAVEVDDSRNVRWRVRDGTAPR